jgi:RNA polymerase sigma-70 factor (ECF subfamily)
VRLSGFASSERIIALTASADRSADALATELTERFWLRLRVFAARRLHDRNVAEDVAQETIRRVLEALRDKRVEKLDALPAFVFQTARNICLHHGRSAYRETGALRRFGSSQSLVTGEEADPLSALIDRNRREQVRVALEEMRPEDRDLLRMLYVDVLDTAEVARRLGIDRGALRVRKHRALQRLAGILGNVSGRSGTEGGV